MTSYQRASAGYDEAFQAELADAIIQAIWDKSRISDAAVVAIRTTESVDALVQVLALVLALSPPVMRSPTAIRRTADQLAKRLRMLVRLAEQNRDLQDFAARSFRNGNVGGRA